MIELEGNEENRMKVYSDFHQARFAVEQVINQGN